SGEGRIFAPSSRRRPGSILLLPFGDAAPFRSEGRVSAKRRQPSHWVPAFAGMTEGAGTTKIENGFLPSPE
ncbi:MAG: hypothetical protein ABW186_00040, partial [Rhodanobacteraceae bacterium]